MKEEFSSSADGLELCYFCPFCGVDNHIIYMKDYLYNDAKYTLNCRACGRSVDVKVHNNTSGSSIEVNCFCEDPLIYVTPLDLSKEEITLEYIKDQLKNGVKVVNNYCKEETSPLSKTLLRWAYVNAIASMECYLFNRLMHWVSSSEDNLRAFVENFEDFKNDKISKSNIFNAINKIKFEVQQQIREILFHNLGKIKPVFKSIMGVDLGDIGELMLCVNKRHTIVHRCGLDYNGTPIEISKTDVEHVTETVIKLIDNLESQFNSIN